MNATTCKGYTGTFEYEPDDEAFHGEVAGIRDVVHFSGRSVEELRQALAEAVDDYLEMCAQAGREPEKPFSGQLRLRLDPQVHRQAAVAAKLAGKSLNAWIAERIEKEVRE